MQFTLAQGYSVTTMLAVAAVAILLAGAFYRRAFRSLKSQQWQTLLALRVGGHSVGCAAAVSPGGELSERAHREADADFSARHFGLDEHRRRCLGRDAIRPGPRKLEKWCEKLKNDFRMLTIPFADRAETARRAR